MRRPPLLVALAATLAAAAAGCASEGPAVAPAADSGTAADRDGDASAVDDATAVVDSAEVAAPDATADTVEADADARAELGACRGTVVPLLLAGRVPYATAAVGASRGAFLLDWGSTASVIDPTGMTPVPSPVAGTTDHWADFAFFGGWGEVVLAPQDLSAFVGPPREAGIIGTDFLALNVYVVDWARGELSRAEPGQGCGDAALVAAGLRPLSTAGYFAKHLDDLLPGVPNVPAVPVRVGRAVAPAQLDTGYDDRVVSPAMNVNRAFFDAIGADVALVPAPELDVVLSTCTGVAEPVSAWRLPAGAAVELVGMDGNAVRREPGAVIYLKETPAAAASCGGIGTWATPAAQLGVSFLARAGRAVIDPETARVWLPGP